MNRIKTYFQTPEKRARSFLNSGNGKILQVATSDMIDQRTLDKSLSEIDIETLSGSDALLLAYAMQRHSKLDFGSYNVPRLNGIIRYCRFRNLNWMSFFSEVACTLNNSGIIPHVSYDIAIKYYMPENYRFSYANSIITTSHEQYNIIRKVLYDSGYSVEDRNSCFEVSGKDEQSVKQIRIADGACLSGDSCNPELQEIRDRCTAAEIFHAQCYVPTPEDVVLIALDRIWKKLRYSADLRGMAFDIWDLYCMIKGQIVSKDALSLKLSETGRHFRQCRYAARFVNRLVPASCGPGWQKKGAR